MTFGAIAFVLIVVLFAVVENLVPRRARLVVWTCIVIGGVVPWSTWVGHSHWDRIEWVPFSRAIRPRDLILNVLFYLPIGWFFVSRRKPTAALSPIAWAGLFGLALSTVTEVTQVFGHGRFPTMTDVVTNTSGTLIGAMLAARRHRQVV